MTTINIEKQELIKILSIGSQFAGKNKSFQVLDTSLVKIYKDCISVTSFDGENQVTINGSILDAIEGELDILVEAKGIIDYVKLIPSDNITMIINDDSTKMKIKHEHGATVMPLMPSDEFPVSDRSDFTKEYHIKSQDLKYLISYGRNFTAHEELRPIMNGIYIYFSRDTVGICGTDSHKLLSIDIHYDGEDFGDEYGFTVNDKAFASIISICGMSDIIDIRVSDNMVEFKAGDEMSIRARLIEGNYPHFRSVIPDNSPIIFSMDKDALIHSIQRAAVSRSVVSSMIVFDIKDGVMTIKASNTDTGKEGKEKLPADTDAVIEIGVRYEQLMTCLSSVDTDEVVIEMRDNTRAILFKDKDSADKTVLLMPVRVL